MPAPLRLSADEKRKNERDTETHAELVRQTSKTQLRKKLCFAFQKNGCPKGAACGLLHSGEPGALRKQILGRLEKKAAAKGSIYTDSWDAKRTPSEDAGGSCKKRKKAAAPDPPSDGMERQIYVKGISKSCSDESIAKEFLQYGEIQRVNHKEGQNLPCCARCLWYNSPCLIFCCCICWEMNRGELLFRGLHICGHSSRCCGELGASGRTVAAAAGRRVRPPVHWHHGGGARAA